MMNALPTRPPFQSPRPNPAQTAMRPSIDFRAAIKRGSSKVPPRIYLYGVEKIGKSTAGALTPSPIFLCAENGLIGTQFEEISQWSSKSWEQILSFLDFLIHEAHEYKTLVVDTLDWLETVLYQYVCTRDQKPNIEAYGYSKGTNVIAPEEFKRFLSKLEELGKKGMGILILSHSKVKAFSNPLGDNYDRYEPKGNQHIAGLVKEWADVVLFAHELVYIDKENKLKAKAIGGKVRVVETEREAAWDAGNRYGLPSQMPLDMPSILEAIAAANGAGGESAQSIIAEIENLQTSLPESIQQRIGTDVAASENDPAALGRILNRVKSTIQNMAPQTQETT